MFEAFCDAKGVITDLRLPALLEGAGFRVVHLPRPSGNIKLTENYVALRGIDEISRASANSRKAWMNLCGSWA